MSQPLGESPAGNAAEPSLLRRLVCNKVTAGVVAVALLLTAEHIYGSSQDDDLRAEVATGQERERQQELEYQRRLDEQGAQLDREAAIAGRLSGVDRDVISGKGLGKASDLPGFGTIVSADQREKLADSSLKIIKRNKGSNDEWQPWCSANKVIIDGTAFVETAGHCFEEQGRIIIPGKGGPEDLAYDIAPLSTADYAVVAPQPEAAQTYPAALLPLAYASGITINLGGTDVALIKPDTQSRPVATDGGVTRFDELTALDSPQSLGAPTPGQEVALQGMPTASGHVRVQAVGINLGRASFSDHYGFLEAVGVRDITSPGQDPCSYGSSGSQGWLADGHRTGPLSRRNNNTFAERENPGDSPRLDQENRLKLEQQLHLNLGEFSTVCMFEIADSTILTALVKAMGHYLPAEFVGQSGMK